MHKLMHMTTTSAQAVEARKAALFAKVSTPALVSALLTLDAIPVRQQTAEQMLSHSWTCTELERRHPEVLDALDEYCDTRTGADGEPTYAQVLIAALRLAPVGR